MKGLNGGQGDSDEGEGKQADPSKHTDKQTVMNAAPRNNKIQPQPQNHPISDDSYAKDQYSFKVDVALPKHKFSGDLKDLDEKKGKFHDW